MVVVYVVMVGVQVVLDVVCVVFDVVFGVVVDYLELCDIGFGLMLFNGFGWLLVVVWFGIIRLLDNIVIEIGIFVGIDCLDGYWVIFELYWRN